MRALLKLLRFLKPYRHFAAIAPLLMVGEVVLDLMQGFLDSSASGKSHAPKSKYHRPKPMPAELPFGQLDD